MIVGFFIVPVSAQEKWLTHLQTDTIENVSLQLSQRFDAEVISRNQTQLAAELQSTVTQIHVRPGERVIQGQTLLTFDCRDHLAQLAELQSQQRQNQAALSLAKLHVTRIQDLHQRQLTALYTLDEARTEVTQREAQQQGLHAKIDIAQRQTQRCELFAPYDGVLLEQQVGVGQWVSLGTPLLRLQQTSQAEIEIHVPFGWLNQTNQAWLAEFSAPSYVPVQLKLLRQSAYIDPQSRTVKLWFAAPEFALVGLSGHVTLFSSQRQLPAHLIVQRQQQLGVFLLVNNALQFKPLEGAQEGRPYPISDDWDLQGRIVTQGQQRLPWPLPESGL